MFDGRSRLVHPYLYRMSIAMRRIVKYEIMEDQKPNRLEAKVLSMMLHGWEPLGGVAVAASSDGGRVYQAMVRYEETHNG